MENSINWVRWMRIRTFLGVVMYICLGLSASLQGFSSESNVGEERKDQRHSPSWISVSKGQLPSELEEHEFALCITALPWCGEARSLMQGIQKAIKDDTSHSFPEMKLFNVHASYDRNLVFGAPYRPSITLYRYGIPYEYSGRRTISALMTSVQDSLSILRSDSVFVKIESLMELETFGDSTDKPVLLIELCGWEEQLRKLKEGDRATNVEMRNFERVEDVLGRENFQTADSRYGHRTGGEISSEMMEEDRNFASGVHESESMLLASKGRRAGDEVDAVSSCFSQDALYCVSGNSVEESDDFSVFVSGHSSPVNVTNSVDGDHLGLYNGSLCSIEEYEKFKGVYQNLSQLAANGILTPERIRFATVTNQEVLLEAGISMQGLPWALLYHMRDLDQHPYVFDGVGDVGEFISDHSAPLVTELDLEGQDIASSISNDAPSVILFVDRISNAPGVREQSRDALEALRTVSYYYTSRARSRRYDVDSDKIEETESEKHEGVIATDEETLVVEGAVDGPRPSSTLGATNLETSSYSKDDDRHLLETKRTPQIEELAQTSDDGEALTPRPSEDLDKPWAGHVRVGADASREMEDSSPHIPILDEGPSFSGDQIPPKNSLAADDKKQLEGSSILSEGSHETSFCDDTRESCTGGVFPKQRSEAAQVYPESTHNSGVLENDLSGTSDRPPGDVETSTENSVPEACNPEVERDCDGLEKDGASKATEDDSVGQIDEEQKQSAGDWNELNFYFIDGGDYNKEKLIGSKATPAVVLISPQTQSHYVLPSNGTTDATSLLRFVDTFLSGDLKRTVSSEPQRPPPRLPPRPPFVKRDFLDSNPVPRVSVDSFSQLVTGVQRTDAHSSEFVCRGDSCFSFKEGSTEHLEGDGGNVTESAWDKDVLVLFTTSWCGFCTRMELVVREVYRSLQQIKSSERHRARVEEDSNGVAKDSPAECSGDDSGAGYDWREGKLRAIDVPVLLQMDCSWNDCSEQLREVLEEENYPAVVLYPARDKFSPIIFDGAPTVRGVFTFLKAHARSSISKPEDNTFNNEPADGKATSYPSSSGPLCDAAGGSTSIKITSSPGTRTLPESEILFWQLNSEHENLFRRSFVGHFLIASEKLSAAATPFASAVVLIVSMPSTNMVHGLILNKALTWKIVPGLDSRVDALLNTAAIGYGGPIMDNQRPLLILTRLNGLEEFVEVVSGLYFGFLRPKGNLLEMIRSERLRAEDFWFFFGYSSWTWQQLQNELYQELWELREYSHNVIKWPQQWSG